MKFLIADTFTSSLSRLTGEEQKFAKTTAFDLQINPTNPGHSFHKLDRAKDKGFWSVRVSRDLRIIVHRSEDRILLCYVGHHDDAYEWAERRKIEAHPKTGAAQLVEIRERIEQIAVPNYVNAPQRKTAKPLFAHLSDDELLVFGVPLEWIPDVKRADEEQLLALTGHLPTEAAEALLELATGGRPHVPEITKPANPFDHPDAQRRFRIMGSLTELQQALDFPWERWSIFLHPDQQQMIERNFKGPVRVSGSAGTGKTVVALHRAAHLARSHQGSRILLTTFSKTLVADLQVKLRRLVGSTPALGDQIDVRPLEDVAQSLYMKQIGSIALATADDIEQALRQAAVQVGERLFTFQFLLAEWNQVVDAWQIDHWEGYRKAPRLGRKTRLPESQRHKLWEILSLAQSELARQGLITSATVCARLAQHFSNKPSPYDFLIMDEAQDLAPMHLRFMAALAGNRPNALFFCGDLGQRIFQQPFSWKALGVDIRGRSKTLKVNYRTSHQIRVQADLLLDKEIGDADENVERRLGTVSLFNGPNPQITVCEDVQHEIEHVAQWITQLRNQGLKPSEFGLFVRSSNQFHRAKEAVQQAGIPFIVLDEVGPARDNSASIGTMHLAKGLEFRAVAVMACDEQVIPLQERLSDVGDDADLEEVYSTERQLLYVACTRARDYLSVTAASPGSEFLMDLERDD